MIKIRLSVMMFLQFFVWGAWFVTLGSYLQEGLGFDGIQVGRSYLMNNLAAIIAPFFVGMIADRYFASEKVMGVLHLMGAAVMYYCTTLTEPGELIFFLLIYNVCYMPTLALVNNISFQQISSTDKEFPMIRVWGTVGWIVAGLVITFVLSRYIEKVEYTHVPMLLAAGCSAVLGLFSFTLPTTPPKMKGEDVSIGDILGFKALSLFKNKNFTVFVIASFLISIPLAFYYSFANPYFNESGMTGTAAKMTLGQVSEVLFMLLIPLLFRRWGVKKMLLFGMAAWVLRYALFAMGDNEAMVWMFYVGILLHGICYDFFFVTGQIYVDNRSPKDVRASAQGLITLITYGLGLGLGSEIAGRVVNAYTTEGIKEWSMIWWLPSIFAAVVIVLFIITFKNESIDSSNGSDT